MEFVSLEIAKKLKEKRYPQGINTNISSYDRSICIFSYLVSTSYNYPFDIF